MNNRYLVAKYAPDLKRMEPENIGVFLWCEGNVAMKFLPEKDAPFIHDHENYKRWLNFWRGEIGGEAIKPIRGEAVPRTSPEFLTALRTTQEGNYLLFDGGRLTTPITAAEIDDATDFLFDEIVSRRRTSEERDSLSDIAERAIQDAGLYDRLQHQYPLICNVLGVRQPVTINYAIVEEKPKAFLQRVNLRQQQSAMYAALIFDSLEHEKRPIDRKHCASLVNSSEHEAPKLLKMLSKVSTVIDLADEAEAVRRLRRVAA